ncbi:hypothetical protein V6N13_051878 [Hibiscus sabdariffa]|uniref:Uncharacterized protein n=1 Tax=Hibiscus sabdariffa TaxID=183260 RepID=A0ABR2T4R5_9ROSI
MVQNCLKAQQALLSNLWQLCSNHDILMSVGGLGSRVALDRQFDGRLKWRPIVLPDNYIKHASPKEQLALAGVTGHRIAAATSSLLGRTR